MKYIINEKKYDLIIKEYLDDLFSNFKINLDILKFKLLRNHLNKKFFTKTILIIKYLFIIQIKPTSASSS